jgi:hypothetical protein
MENDSTELFYFKILTDLFLDVYEADVHQGLLMNTDRTLTMVINSSFCYAEDVM